MVRTYILAQRALIRTHATHMTPPLGPYRFIIIGIKINIHFHHLNTWIKREIGLRHTFRRQFSGDNSDGMIRVLRQPIDFLSQHTFHPSGVIEMRYTIKDIHCTTSFFLICEIPMTIARSRRLQVTKRGSKSNGARG